MWAAVAAICLGFGEGCGPARGPVKEIRVDGSSTVFPVMEALAEEFQNARWGAVRVTVGISGTGGGFKKFLRRETDLSTASRPILAEEIATARAEGLEYIELPLCYDALTIVVNPRNTWADHITVEELRKIWAPESKDRITRWSQVRAGWPDRPFRLFGAGSDSGTFDYFTEAVVGKAKASRSDFTASEDDNVLVQGVAGDLDALGYLPFAYYELNRSRLKALAVQWDRNRVSEPVAPNLDNVLKGIYNPLSRPMFVYVNRDSAERPEVREFLEFLFEEGPALVEEVKYLPLPPEARELARARFEARVVGSAFGGVPEVGVPVEELLRRETAAASGPGH